MEQPKLAVWKFSSCDGCQLTLLDCEDHLLEISQNIKIAYFKEASRRELPGPYDLSLVEGSITTSEEVQRIQKIRKESRFLVVIGACATSGGIQALRNYASVKDYVKTVYAHPSYIKTLSQSSPISDYVKIDFELRGCPISKEQLLETIISFLNKRKPQIKNESVCAECKSQNIVCLLVAKKNPCLGPITHSGCQALCPKYSRGCFGCYGPKQPLNISSLRNYFKENLKLNEDEILNLLSTFNVNAFRKDLR